MATLLVADHDPIAIVIDELNDGPPVEVEQGRTSTAVLRRPGKG
jgi:hypothetical protein